MSAKPFQNSFWPDPGLFLFIELRYTSHMGTTGVHKQIDIYHMNKCYWMSTNVSSVASTKILQKKFERALVAQCCNLSREMLLFGWKKHRMVVRIAPNHKKATTLRSLRHNSPNQLLYQCAGNFCPIQLEQSLMGQKVLLKTPMNNAEFTCCRFSKYYLNKFLVNYLINWAQSAMDVTSCTAKQFVMEKLVVLLPPWESCFKRHF